MAEQDIPSLIGHQAQQAMLAGLQREGRLPHAMLLHGPKGIGKRLFAEALARSILCGPAESLLGDDGLSYNTAHKQYPQIVAASHPDYHVLVTEEDKKSISIGQVRHLNSLLALTADGARTIIVDAAEDMTTSAANAMLKSLEEPGQAVHWILISHSFSRLLPTVVSRCRAVRFAPLDENDSLKVMQTIYPAEPMEKLQQINGFVKGCPGQAERYMGAAAEVGDMLDKFLKGIAPTPQARRAAMALSDTTGQKRVSEVALDVLLTRLAAAARSSATQNQPVFGLDAYALSTVYQATVLRKRRMETLNVNATATLDAALEDIINATQGIMPRLVA